MTVSSTWRFNLRYLCLKSADDWTFTEAHNFVEQFFGWDISVTELML